jgi:hypothetical protein
MDVQWMQDVKNAFDLVRLALGTASDVKALLPDGPQRQAATAAIENAENQTKIAEASIAKALGYELCKCSFPPTPMLTVGHRMTAGKPVIVFECSKCSITTAGGFSFTRTKSNGP